jgi:hypothetical protein
MDTVTKDTEGYMHGEYMMEGDSMMNNFAQGDMKDTLLEGVEMMPEGQGGMEVASSHSMGNKPDELESVVGLESLKHYPHHYGGGHTQLLSPATITKDGVELGCITGWPITGEHLAHNVFDMELDGTHTPLPGPKDISDNNSNISVSNYLGPAHTAYLGAQAEQSKSVINCAFLSTGVQQPDDSADLRKFMRESASPNPDRTPGVVVSELLGIFGDVEKGCMVGLESGVTILEDNIHYL